MRTMFCPFILCLFELAILASYCESTSADPYTGCLFQRFVPLRMHLKPKSQKADAIVQQNGVGSLLSLRGGISLRDTNVSMHAGVSRLVSQDSLEGDLGMEGDDPLTDDELLSLGRLCHASKDFSGAATYFSQLVQRQASTDNQQ